VRLVDRAGQLVATLRLTGVGHPDLAAVDWLARVQLDAIRRDQSVEITAICHELAELVELAGLCRRECEG
jgi:ABC-type transporter Mla MlaB component